jgi:hypothetical protein
MSADTGTGTYVYGVLSADAEAPSISGIGGAPLREIKSGEIAALVSDMGDDELKLGRQELTTHARVLEEALQHGTVLPMRFGVVMAGEPAVKSGLLDAHRDELGRQLSEMTGKVELRLRAVYDEDAVMREILDEDLEIARLRASLRGKTEDATYYGRIQLGEMVAKAIGRKREVDAARILQALTPLALDVQIGEPNNDRIVVNASFLVEREQMPPFDGAVDEVGREQAGRMRLKYTGPLPPHSFVQLRTEA